MYYEVINRIFVHFIFLIRQTWDPLMKCLVNIVQNGIENKKLIWNYRSLEYQRDNDNLGMGSV